MKSRSVLLFAICALGAALGFGAQSPDALKIEDALLLSRFDNRTPIALSPDCRSVAYTLVKPRGDNSPIGENYRDYSLTGAPQESANHEVWVTETLTGESRNLTGNKGASWGPVWSPDSKYLAFYSDRTGVAHLWIWERATGKSRQLSDVIVRPFFGFEVVRWSPDSRAILTKVLPEGLSLEQAADLIAGNPEKTKGASSFADGPTVTIFSSLPAQKSVKDPSSTNLRSASWINRDLADLALIDVGTGKVKRVVKSVRPRGYWFSPDGHSIAFTDLKGVAPNTQQVSYDLMILPLESLQTRVLVPDVRQDYGVSVSWSPDGTKLGYMMSRPDTQVDGFVVSLESGETRNVTPSPHAAFDGHYGVPVWDDKSQVLYFISGSLPTIGRQGSDVVWKASLGDKSFRELARIPGKEVLGIAGPVGGGRLWSPDNGRSLVLMTRDNATKQEGFWKVALNTGQASKLAEDASHFVGPRVNFTMDVDYEARTLVYLRQDAQHSDDIWITGADFENQRRLTHANPQLENVAFGPIRLIGWNRADGQLITGGLLLPSNYDKTKRYPLVVFVYGNGLQSDYVNQFGAWGGVLNMQILATRGYAVLLPDTPLRKGTQMEDLLKTVMPGVDKTIELGVADPDRLAVMGQSYGGYSTLALIVQTTRFKAAVDCDGPSNLISNYGAMRPDGSASGIGLTETGQGGMEGTPWQYRDRYIANSPIFFLDRVQTPLLIIQGQMDQTVPHTQAEEVFVGLRRLRKEVVYALYAGEDHAVGYGRLANGVDMWNRIIAWFDAHLKKPEKTECTKQ